MSNVRNTLNAVRYDWLGVRIGGPGASMQGLWPVLAVAVLIVFGCFFAIGRAFAGGAPPAEGSSAAPVARVAIPDGLEGGSPIAGQVPSAITAPPPRRKPRQVSGAAVLRATSPSGFTGEATSSSTAESTAAPEPEPTEPAPSVASAPASRGGGSHSSSGGSAGHGSSGGRSFDSSE